MKNLRLNLLWVLLLLATPVLAQSQYANTLYIEDTKALVGTDVTLSVKMKNSVSVEAFGFDLILPYGMTVITDDEGIPLAQLSEERTTARRTDTFGAAILQAYLNNRAVRVIAASSSGSAISPGDGEVCTIRVRIPAGQLVGTYKLQLANISLADTESRSIDVEEMTSLLTVGDVDLGDANGDGQVNVADLIAIAHHILGHTPVEFSFKGADVNRDFRVNVADYIAVAHRLGEDPTQSQGGFPRRPPTTLQPITTE
ncbi:MAG: dockerin type I repeat-containing protein [Prevotella sp.]|nr:dockerin type I repeat-containing protein [Prevotella sp.]